MHLDEVTILLCMSFLLRIVVFQKSQQKQFSKRIFGTHGKTPISATNRAILPNSVSIDRELKGASFKTLLDFVTPRGA
jgi:hypothetical protein